MTDECKTVTELIEIHHKAVHTCGKMTHECATNPFLQGFAAASTECCILHIDAEELLKAAGDDARKQQEAREKSKVAISFEKNVRFQINAKEKTVGPVMLRRAIGLGWLEKDSKKQVVEKGDAPLRSLASWPQIIPGEKE